MAAVSNARARNNVETKVPAGKPLTCAQRIENATVKRTQVTTTEMQLWDAEALFRKFDSEDTQLLSRGSLTELLRFVDLEHVMGDGFNATAQLAFDAHSADSHFLSFPEFRQLYYHICKWHPGVLPRTPSLKIQIVSAKNVPSADLNGKSDPFCCVSVKGKPYTMSRTRVIPKTLDPKWDEEFCDKFGYEEGESLLFEVYDDDPGEDAERLGHAELPAAEFHRPGGFDGKLPLVVDKPGHVSTLNLRVSVNGMVCPPPDLQVLIKGAKGLPPADPNGKSDPFCVFQIEGKPYTRCSTKIIRKTLEPQWDEEFDDKYRYREGDTVTFEIFDYDQGGKFDLLGQCSIHSNQFHSQGGFEGSIPLTDVSMKNFNPTLQVALHIRSLMPEPERPAVEQPPLGATGATGAAPAAAAAA